MSDKFGQCRRNLGRCWPTLAKAWPTLVEHCQIRPKSSKCCPNLSCLRSLGCCCRRLVRLLHQGSESCAEYSSGCTVHPLQRRAAMWSAMTDRQSCRRGRRGRGLCPCSGWVCGTLLSVSETTPCCASADFSPNLAQVGQGVTQNGRFGPNAGRNLFGGWAIEEFAGIAGGNFRAISGWAAQRCARSLLFGCWGCDSEPPNPQREDPERMEHVLGSDEAVTQQQASPSRPNGPDGSNDSHSCLPLECGSGGGTTRSSRS